MFADKFYPRGQYYSNSKGPFGLRFIDACPKELTVRRNPTFAFQPIPDNAHRLQTVFREVSVVLYAETMPIEVQAFCETPMPPQPIKLEDFCNRFFDELMRVIVDWWHPGKFHVVMHSSGFDSRLIATAIKRVYEAKGKSWLRDVLFLEVDGETDGFLESMKIEGWKPSQYAVYNADSHSSEYHERSIEFSGAWERLNGVSGYPVNIWWEPIAWAQETGLVPADDQQIQTWTGYGSNEIVKALKDIHSYFEWAYYLTLSRFPLKGECVHPFYNLEFIRKAIVHGGGHFISNSLSKIILQHVDPALALIHSVATREKSETVRSLSENIMDRAEKDYKSSWFGKDVRPDVRPTSNRIEYSDWWGFWSLASLCEHLLAEGYTLTCEY